MEEEEEGSLQTYSLLQKVNTQFATGHKCSQVLSKFTYVCANSLVASHQRLATIPEIEVPTTFTPDQCREMVATKQF